jgi:hypothetical protein
VNDVGGGGTKKTPFGTKGMLFATDTPDGKPYIVRFLR